MRYYHHGKKMLQTEEIEYLVGDTLCRGFIASDNTLPKHKPCVLIAHDWSGRSDFFCKKAEQLATMGYIGFAVDLYGEAKTGQTTEERRALLSPIMANRPIVTTRMLGAFDTATRLSGVDATKIAAIGYCFGGLSVLDLARSGADALGVVSFHGTLLAPEQAVCEKVRAKILVLHGYDDPMVSPTEVNRFAKEMTLKKVDWQIHMYGHAQHSFTNPLANDAALGLHYNEKADRRSWASAQAFLDELF